MAAERWYRRFFTADWWELVRDEYSDERTRAEVAYLDATLTELAPGKRVLDLGCGTGRHAVALAAAGYRVTGVDVAPVALRLARERAEAAGVEVDWVELDLLGGAEWRLPEVDAAICVQSFGWGSDGEQLRLLRGVYRCLVPGGLLVLDHSNLAAILRGYVPEAEVERDGTRFGFRRRFEVLTGRNIGEVRVRRAAGGGAVLRDDVRLYLPHEVARLLRAAGFEVLRADADFSAGAEPDQGTRYVQFVARRAAPAAARLALGDHAGDAAGSLDLRTAPDEAGYVREPLEAAWREVLAGGAAATAEAARAYALADPFGAARAAPVLAAHHGHPVEASMVALGAGSTGLLHDLAALAAGAAIVHDPLGHPDLPAWARRFGAETVTAPLGGPAGGDRAGDGDLPGGGLVGGGLPGAGPAGAGLAGAGGLAAGGGSAGRDPAGAGDPAAGGGGLADGGLDFDAITAVIEAARPALVVLDRPGVRGYLAPLDQVTRLAELAAGAGAILVVDEACATYAGPAASATRLAAVTPNLVVVRSMSKGYCCGGLRVGYAVASPGLMADLREVLTPLAASALAVEVALRLLAMGDVLGPLRARVAALKPAVAEALTRAGLDVTEGDPCLPWVTLPADERTIALLAARRVTAKRCAAAPPAPAGRATAPPAADVLRLSVPLAPERVAAFLDAFPEGMGLLHGGGHPAAPGPR